MDESDFRAPDVPNPSTWDQLATAAADIADYAKSFPFTPKRDYLTGRDNIFIPYERMGFLSNVGSVYTLSAKLGRDTVVNQIENFGLAVGSRYLKRVNRNQWLFGRPYWEDAEFDVRNHLMFKRLPAGANDLAALKRVAEELHSTPLDWRFPLWHVTCIEGFVDDGKEKTALIWRIHHCVGDGMALTGALMTFMAKLDPETGLANLGKEAGDIRRLAFKAGRKKSIAEVTADKVRDWRTRATETYNEWAERFMGIVIYIASLIFLIFFAARREKRGLIGKDAVQRRGSQLKQVGWCEPVPLAEVVRIKNVLGVTLNDVMVSCFNGAMRTYLERRHANRDEYFVWLIPKSLRAAHDFALSNETSGYMLAVPSKEPDPVHRVKEVNRRMGILKRSVEPESTYGLVSDMVLPWVRFEQGVDSMLSRSFGAITNVPGPNRRFKWGNVEIEYMRGLMMSIPGGIGCAIGSYADHVMLSMTTDVFAVPQTELFAPGMADEIVRNFQDEIRSLSLACDDISRQLVGNLVSKVGPEAVKDALKQIESNGGLKKESSA